MQKFNLLLVVLAIALASCNSSKESDQSAILAFNPEKGLKKEMVYELKLESPSQNAALHYTINVDFEVEDIHDSLIDIKLTYNSVSMKGNVDTLNIDVKAGVPDSNQIEGSLYAQPYFMCLNHEFLVTFDKKMKKVSEMLLTEKDPGSLTAPSNKVQFFTVLPASEIKEGTTWTDVIELKSGKNHSVVSEFKINRIENGIIKGEFSGDLDGSGKQFDLDYSIKGKVFGSFEIDSESGLTLKSEMTQDLILIMSEKETPMKFIIKQYFK